MVLLRNIVLFFIGFLPAVAVVSMVVAAVFRDGAESSSDLSVGWNPLLALIVTAPWLIPTVLVVPLLHILGSCAANRFSLPKARGVLLGASPAAFTVAVLILWGPQNFRLEFVLPVVISGVLYGALQKIPAEPTSGAARSS
jgi:hypothetical protein